MLIKTLQLGQLETNCYIVTDENTLQCAVIDPGDESNTVLNYLERNHLKCEYILITHGHYDHTMAVKPLANATGATVCMNKKDSNATITNAPFRFIPPEGTVFYSEGDIIKVGGLEFHVIETPGHTPGGVTLRCENALFTGDTLFSGSCGRTDFPGGDMDELMRSLKKICDIEGDLEVYPGHMDSSTLERERRFNYYVKYAYEQ
jgi:hydroxyacylglutathione hydrolase